MNEQLIPTLRTSRLVLRAFHTGDIADYAAIRQEPAVGRFIGGVKTTEETWDRMAVMNGQWLLRGYGVFAIELAATGRVIGHAGVLHPIDWPDPEIAYSLGSAHWGQGLAAEAAAAVRDWAFSSGRFAALSSFIDPSNTQSIRVAEKLGAKRGGSLTLRGHAVERWTHVNPQAERLPPKAD